MDKNGLFRVDGRINGKQKENVQIVNFQMINVWSEWYMVNK